MSIQKAYEILFVSSVIFLAFLAGIMLVRSIKSSSVCDRLLCVNMISSIVISLILILSAKSFDPSLIDIALIYVLISFMAVVIFAKIYIPLGDNNRHPEDEDDRMD